MYDASWRLLDRLYQVAERTVGCGQSEELLLEPTMFAWALQVHIRSPTARREFRASPLGKGRGVISHTFSCMVARA